MRLTRCDDSLPRVECEFLVGRRERVDGLDVAFVSQNHLVFVFGTQKYVPQIQRGKIEFQSDKWRGGSNE